METTAEKMENAENINEGMSLSVENSVPLDAVRNCNLCGSSTPAVKCDKCGSQTFCLSCDDMYHRHPKRRFHLRKAVDSIWNSHRSPRFRRRTELPGDPSKIPIPPPRTKKRHSSSDLGGLFRPNFQAPGFKGYWPQKKASEFKNQELSDKSASPISPEPGYDTVADDNVTNGMKNGLADKSNENAVRSLQRRSSADSPSFNENTSSPVNLFVPGTLPMQVDPQGRNTPGFAPQFSGHGMHHSMSNADLSTSSPQTVPPMYPFPPHMHPFFPPHMNPYAPPMAPFNCPQCVSASWSNLMSASMAQFHQHHHLPQQMASPLSGTLRGHSPSPEAFAKQNQNAVFQGVPYSSSPLMQQDTPATPEGSTTKISAPDTADHAPPPPPASPLTTEVQNAASEAEQRGQQQQLQQILGSDEEMEEDEGEEEAADDEPVKIPEKPTEPWTCVHCTYINPPGSHICDVCCKTSYNISSESGSGSKRKRKKKQVTEKIAETSVASDGAGPSKDVAMEKVMQL